MYQGWAADDVNIRVFRDVKLARVWLGLPPEKE
jgi:hypothetical protein